MSSLSGRRQPALPLEANMNPAIATAIDLIDQAYERQRFLRLTLSDDSLDLASRRALEADLREIAGQQKELRIALSAALRSARASALTNSR